MRASCRSRSSASHSMLWMATVCVMVSVCMHVAQSARTGNKTLHFNNDLTNTYSENSTFHEKGQPFTGDTIRGAVAETASVGITTHLLSPGFCWVAWWPSTYAPLQAYHDWMVSTFGPPPSLNSTGAAIFSYALSGGDIIKDFVTAAHAAGERPSITFRINDMQSCDKTPIENYGMLSKFWYDHRNDPDIMYAKAFNDTCCWHHTCPCECYDGSASMVLDAEPVLTDRRALMLEILHMYPGIDFEIDFERWDRVFRPDKTTTSSRQAIIVGLLRDLRAAMSPGAQLGLRVPPDLALLDSIGVNLVNLSTDPAIKLDYATLGVSYFSMIASTSDFAKIRNTVDIPLYFGVTNLLTQNAQHRSNSELLTNEMLATVAMDAYSLGADGLSTFNYEYYRSIGLEPPYDTLAHLKDEAWVNKTTQHWFYIPRSGSSQSGSGPLPLKPTEHVNTSMAVRIVPPTGGAYVGTGLLRMARGWQAWGFTDGVVTAALNGVELTPTANNSRPYPTKVPDLGTGGWAGFQVPLGVVRAGDNTISVMCASACNGLSIEHVELILPVA
eukprot:m.127558 g.127558  ORF g.127558 m.127558 type:complete len:555 (-) comp11212_c0_seq1:3725-5389(-)